MAIRHDRSTFRAASPCGYLYFLHIILLILHPQGSSCTETGIPGNQDPAETPETPNQKLLDLENLLDRQEIHLQKLEDLVKILHQTVDKLQPGRAQQRPSPGPTMVEPDNCPDAEEEKAAEASEGESLKAGRRSSRASGKGKGVTVAKFRPAWSERFQFLSAVKMESDVTCLNVLPHEGDDGVGKYVAVGDAQGRVYILFSHGEVLVDFLTLSTAPVTAMLSYLSFEKNETVLVTGHADGTVLLHRVWETTQTTQHATAAGDEWHALAMEHVRVLSKFGQDNNPPGAVVGLEVHRVGRMRYVLGIGSQGRIHVFRENGTLYGVAESSSGSRPLAFLRQRLLFLTETGAGSLDLRSMTVRTGQCEGLNGSRAVAYAFDAAERSKGYGFTSAGDLIHVVLMGDVLKFECRVKSKRRSEIEGGETVEVRAIKGYLLVSTPEKVFVYNTTTQQYIRVAGPRHLFYATLDQIASAFAPVSKNPGDAPALIACNRDRLVVIGLGNGYVGVYRSTLPVHKAEFNTMLWSSPVLVFILFLIGAWHFFGKKREAFAIWGSDDIYSATPAVGSSLSGVSGERSNEDTSTRPEVIRDIRESFRGATRRYVSPSGYPARQSGYGGGTGAISYRGSTVDPNYRPTAETNFRSQTVETSSYAKRREPLFTNSQVVEDNIH